jgi:hypothetical protein
LSFCEPTTVPQGASDDGFYHSCALCYDANMKDTIDRIVDITPSATPTEEDIRKWDALPRDEQLRRLRTALTHPDCATATPDTMSSILAEARARADSHRG